MLIAIEGADACGKTTQCELLAKRLDGVHIPFPNDRTPVGALIRAHLKEMWSCGYMDMMPVNRSDPWWPKLKLLNPMVFQCLQTVNRIEMLPTVRIFQEAGRHVVFGRYYVSALVYGGLDGLNPEWIRQTQCVLPEPDVWILLDIPVEEGFKRKSVGRDRYEADRAFIENVHRGFRAHFNQAAVVNGGARWQIVDGMGTVEEVHERIWEIVEPLLSAVG
jgi:Thymidylate kinase